MISTSAKPRHPGRQHTRLGGTAPCLVPPLRLEMVFISAGVATIPSVEMIKGSADFPAESKPAKGLFLLGRGGGDVPTRSCLDGYPPLPASELNPAAARGKDSDSNGHAGWFGFAAASWSQMDIPIGVLSGVRRAAQPQGKSSKGRMLLWPFRRAFHRTACPAEQSRGSQLSFGKGKVFHEALRFSSPASSCPNTYRVGSRKGKPPAGWQAEPAGGATG